MCSAVGAFRTTADYRLHDSSSVHGRFHRGPSLYIFSPRATLLKNVDRNLSSGRRDKDKSIHIPHFLLFILKMSSILFSDCPTGGRWGFPKMVGTEPFRKCIVQHRERSSVRPVQILKRYHSLIVSSDMIGLIPMSLPFLFNIFCCCGTASYNFALTPLFT